MPGLRNAACSPARTRPIAHKGPHEKIALPSSARAAGASRCEVVPRVSSGLGVFGAATLAALLGGCVHYEVSTEIRVRDPARVEVRDRASGETVLSAGSTPAEARVAHGVFATGPSTSGDYEVQVRRAPGGALRYDVDTRIALSTGEHVAILGGDGKLVPLGPSNDPALDPHTPAFIVPVCGRLVRFHTRYSQGTAATTGEGCSARSTYGATLAIPWDDSVEVRRVERVDYERPLGWALSVLLGGGLLAGGVIVGAQGLSSNTSSEKVIGASLLAAAVTVVVALLPWTLASDRETVLYPGNP